MMERYEGRAHCSGSSDTSMGSSTQRPLIEIQELIPNRTASRSTRKILRLRPNIFFIFSITSRFSVTVTTILNLYEIVLKYEEK